jgi:hypothetical protein
MSSVRTRGNYEGCYVTVAENFGIRAVRILKVLQDLQMRFEETNIRETLM